MPLGVVIFIMVFYLQDATNLVLYLHITLVHQPAGASLISTTSHDSSVQSLRKKKRKTDVLYIASGMYAGVHTGVYAGVYAVVYEYMRMCKYSG